MWIEKVTPRSAAVLVLLFLAGNAYGQDRSEVKEPYSLYTQASRSATGIEVTATIRTVDPQKYPLPTSIKQLVADPDDGPKNHLEKYTANDLPVTNGAARFVLRGYDNCQGFHFKVHFKVEGWHDEHLDDDNHVFSRPNLRVDKITAPEKVYTNSAFAVQATIRELNGDNGATTTVTLSEGAIVLATVANVAVLKGASANVVFPNISATTPGKHTYTVTISNTIPPEFDNSNNSRTFSVNVLAKPDLRVEKINAPDEVFANTTFEIQAFIREAGGSTDATVTVSLYDGTTLVGSESRVDVHSGSLERVTFRKITPSTPGPHVYAVTITGSNPPESNVANNSSSVTVRVLLRPDLRVESASAGSPVFVNTTFDIDAVVREFNSQSGASATVTLSEGKDRQASPEKVVIAPGGTAHAIFRNIKERTPGVHTYAIKITDVDPCESNDDNNSYSFTLTVLVRPDLIVDKVTSPSAVTTGVPFTVDALIKEVDGQTGVTATVTLSEGNTALGTFSNVSVPGAGSATISFTGITAPTAGTHSYTVKITNAVPSESDVTNNSRSFSVSASGKPDLRVNNVTAPASAQVGSTFALSASIKEYLGTVGATASVTLYDGTTVVGSPQAITVSAGGTANVTFSGIVAATPGSHTFAVRVSGAIPAESDITNNDYVVTINVLAKPDLIVEQLIVPAQINAGTPFTVQAVIRELTGQTSANALASLYEGALLVGAPQSIAVSAGGSTTVSFAGITETVAGTHTFTAVISGATPGESDVTNNQNSSTTTVSDVSPMDLSLSFEYNRSLNLRRQTSTYGWFLFDSTYTESGTFSCTATATASTPPPSPLTGISWTISTPAGVIDQVSFSNIVRTSGDATTDYYSVSNVNNKGIEFTLSVNLSSGLIQASIDQHGSFSEHFFTTQEANIHTLSGIRENVFQPNNSISVAFTLQGGGSAWGGTTTIPVSPLVRMDSTRTLVEEWISIEDGTKLVTETISVGFQASGPNPPTLPASTPAAVMAAAEERVVAALPEKFGLGQNFPNPFNPSTTFEFALPKPAFVTLKVYDMLAREVATVVSRQFEAGVQRVQWNASSLPTGMYVYRLRAGDFLSQKKLMLVK